MKEVEVVNPFILTAVTVPYNLQISSAANGQMASAW
jgi:hypothetical protein